LGYNSQADSVSEEEMEDFTVRELQKSAQQSISILFSLIQSTLSVNKEI